MEAVHVRVNQGSERKAESVAGLQLSEACLLLLTCVFREAPPSLKVPQPCETPRPVREQVVKAQVQIQP